MPNGDSYGMHLHHMRQVKAARKALSKPSGQRTAFEQSALDSLRANGNDPTRCPTCKQVWPEQCDVRAADKVVSPVDDDA